MRYCLICLSKFLFLLKGFADGNGNCSVVAGEDIVNKLFLRLPCNKADDGNYNERGKHCECAAVDGALNDRREVRAEEHIDNHDTRTPDEADCAGGLCDPFPVQAVEERSEERACKRTPRKTHQLSNERAFALELNNGDNCRNNDEHKDEGTDYYKSAFFVLFL